MFLVLLIGNPGSVLALPYVMYSNFLFKIYD